jgi:hypothetical protein
MHEPGPIRSFLRRLIPPLCERPLGNPDSLRHLLAVMPSLAFGNAEVKLLLQFRGKAKMRVTLLAICIGLLLAACNNNTQTGSGYPPPFTGFPNVIPVSPYCSLSNSPMSQQQFCVEAARYNACNCEYFCRSQFGRPPQNSDPRFNVNHYNACLCACNNAHQRQHAACYNAAPPQPLVCPRGY